MAAPSYANDLTDIFTDGSTTGWSALGGGASGLNQETDYFIQGTSCLSKNAWASALKGMIYVPGGSVTVPTDGCVMFWLTHLTPNSLDPIASGGVQALIGSSSTAFKQWYVAGSDTVLFGGWLAIPVNPTITPDATTGSPSATLASFGGQASLTGARPRVPRGVSTRFATGAARSRSRTATLARPRRSQARTHGSRTPRRGGMAR